MGRWSQSLDALQRLEQRLFERSKRGWLRRQAQIGVTPASIERRFALGVATSENPSTL
jgi:hypothetical protein